MNIAKFTRRRPERKRWIAHVIWWNVCLSLGCAVCMVGRADGSLSEYQVKALFLLNFAKYVDWPAASLAETNGPFTIGVFGENKFGDDLQKVVAGKNVGGRGLAVRQIESAGDAGKCSILFISGSEKEHLAEILDRVKDAPVLTVGESEEFFKQGGGIKFTMKEGKVRLEVNLESTRRAHLQISSKLLKVADTVKGKTN
jgi:YfiR/HmsC-like